MKKKIICGIIIFCLFLMYLIFNRAMPLDQLFSMLTLDKCTEVYVYYEVGNPGDDLQEVVIEKDSEDFQKISTLFYDNFYKRNLRNFLQVGTKYHEIKDEDYRWEVYFCFKDVTLSDGSIGSGTMLNFSYSYGELDISFDGDVYSCSTKNQEEWAKEILSIVQ